MGSLQPTVWVGQRPEPVQRRSRKRLAPTLGYAMPYADGSVLPAPRGTVIVALIP